jgi:cytoskeletal protein RodZ
MESGNPLERRRKDRQKEHNRWWYLFTMLSVSALTLGLGLWFIYGINEDQTAKINEQTQQIKTLQETNNCLLNLHIDQTVSPSEREECQRKVDGAQQSVNQVPQVGPQGPQGVPGPTGPSGSSNQGLVPDSVPILGDL